MSEHDEKQPVNGAEEQPAVSPPEASQVETEKRSGEGQEIVETEVPKVEDTVSKTALDDFDPDAGLSEDNVSVTGTLLDDQQPDDGPKEQVQPDEAGISPAPVAAEAEKSAEAGEPAPEARPKKGKKGVVIGVSILAVLLILGGAFAAFVFAGSSLSEEKIQELYQSGRYLDGVSIYDIAVGGMTKEEARAAVTKGLEKAGDKTLLTLKLKDQEIPVISKEIQTENSLEDVLNKAMVYGREGNYFERKAMEKETKESGKNFTLDFKAGDEALTAFAKAVAEKYSVPAKDADIQINESGGERFTYVPEQIGLTIKEAELKEQIKDYVENNRTGAITVAYEETQPSVTLEQLKTNFVKVSSFSTSGIGSGNRGQNIMEAAKIINGTKLMPGESHDIEAILNAKQYAGRWKKASTYVDGEVVDGYGGGICQVSTTLFNAALMANMDIVQRSNHSMTVGYVELGFDAAISSGGPKLVIKNNTDYPMYIFASANTSKLTIEIYGKQLPWGAGTTYKRISKVLSSGANGAKKVQATLLYFDQNGTQVSSRTWNSNYRGKKAAETEKPAIAPGNETEAPAITTKQTTTTQTQTQNPPITTKPEGN